LPLTVPKGGGKTEHYGKVHASNLSGKFCNESSAYKKLVDKKRKRLQNAVAKSRELLTACQITRMKPLTSYFESKNIKTPTGITKRNMTMIWRRKKSQN